MLDFDENTKHLFSDSLTYQMIMLMFNLKLMIVLKLVLMLVLGLGSGWLIFLPLDVFGDLGRGPFIWHRLDICPVSVIVLRTTLVLSALDVQISSTSRLKLFGLTFNLSQKLAVPILRLLPTSKPVQCIEERVPVDCVVFW
jgi:hypothetical protein